MGLCPPVVFGFLRLATSRRVFDPPMTLAQATRCVEEWLARPTVEYLADSERHLTVAMAILREVGAAGRLTTDAQIAAQARICRGTVYTHDTDFSRFEVPWIDPLA